MTLKEKWFECADELCKFVNEHEVIVEQISVVFNNFYLFYWEKKNND